MMQSSVVVALGQYETCKFGMWTVRKILYIVYFCIFLCLSTLMVLGCIYTQIYIVVMETSDIITNSYNLGLAKFYSSAGKNTTRFLAES